MSSYDRDKKLEEFIKQSNIQNEDFIRREYAKIRQCHEQEFEQELRKFQECNMRGDLVQAYYHYTVAESINEFLKALESESTGSLIDS